MPLPRGADVRRGLCLGQLGVRLGMDHLASSYLGYKLKMMKRDDIIWLSGLLEGEAWFGLDRGKYPRIGLEMTDEDIVNRVAVIWDVKVNHYKNFWVAVVCGARAIEWMITLYPFLGIRRREKVASVIKFWWEYAYAHVPKGVKTMATCHPDRIVHSFGLCNACYQRQHRKKQLLKLVG